jgi:hypothetical protein
MLVRGPRTMRKIPDPGSLRRITRIPPAVKASALPIAATTALRRDASDAHCHNMAADLCSVVTSDNVESDALLVVADIAKSSAFSLEA